MIGDDRLMTSFPSLGDLGADVLNEGGDGGHTADDDARIYFHNPVCLSAGIVVGG